MKYIQSLIYLWSVFFLISCASTKTFKVTGPTKVAGNHFLVGSAEKNITPPPGYPMGGYGSGGKISRGTWLELKARATYIQDAKGERMVIINADLWSVPVGLTLAIANNLQKIGTPYDLGTEQILLTATHTHNSQGNFHTSEAYNALASPISGFDPDMFNSLSHAITRVVVEAIDNKTKARGAISRADLSGLIRNRSIDAFRKLAEEAKKDIMSQVLHPEQYLNESDLPAFVISAEEYAAVDPTVTTLVFRAEENASATPIAMINFLSLHPTIMGPTTEVFSPDVFGVIERRIKNKLGFHSSVISFINGSEGDISANWKANDIKNTIDIGNLIADRIISGFSSSKSLFDHIPTLSIAYNIVDISDASVAIPLRGNVPPCVRQIDSKTAQHPYPGIATLGGAEDGRTELYYKGMKEGLLSTNCIEGHGEKSSAIPAAVNEMFAPLPVLLRGFIKASFQDMIKKTAPTHLPLALYQLGDITIATVPGEPTTGVGYYIKKAVAKELNIKESNNILIAGLSNEYMSYFTTPAEYAAQHYEGASTMFGVHAGSFLEQEISKLADSSHHIKYETKEIKTRPGKEVHTQKTSLDSLWKIEESLTNFMVDLESGDAKNRFPIFQFTSKKDTNYPYPTIMLETKMSEAGKWKKYKSDKQDIHFVKAVSSMTKEDLTWQILYLGDLENDAAYRFSTIINGKTLVSTPFYGKNVTPLFTVSPQD